MSTPVNWAGWALDFSAARPRAASPLEQHVGLRVDDVSELTIAAPMERVATFAADPENAPLWYQNISSVEWRTPRQNGL